MISTNQYKHGELPLSNNNHVGTCFLCGASDVNLMRSHFLPKHVYKKINKGLIKRGHAKMLLHKGVSKEMTREITDWKFCSCCEGKLSKNGENYFSNNAMPSITNKEPILLKQIILNTPISHKEDSLVYAYDFIEKSDEKKLLYFIVSMFWRGTLEWPNFVKYDFPPEIEHEIKLFLNEDIDNVTKFHITVDVAVKNEMFCIFFPSKTKIGNNSRYVFTIFSYTFTLIPFPSLTNETTIFYGRNFSTEQKIKESFNRLHKNAERFGNKPHDISWNK